jgi:hypothetical protein
MAQEHLMAIAVAEARPACAGEPDIVERVKKAMRVCNNHWMVTAEVHRVNAALAAAALESNEKERDRITRSGSAMNKANNALAALISGVPVDLEALSAQMPKEDDLLPIMDMWNAVKKGK